MWQPHPIPEAPPPHALSPHARILVVKLASAGDLLLATPALRALRTRYPNATIHLLTTPAGAELFKGSPLLDRCIPFEKYGFDAPAELLRHPERLARLAPFCAALRSARYDAVLLLHHLTLRFGRMKYRALLAATSAPLRVGLDNGWGSFLSLRVPDAGFGARHEAEYNLDVAAAVDATLPEGERDLRLADLGWQLPAVAKVRNATPPCIAIHPGGGRYSLARRWPATRYASLLERLHAEIDATFVLVGGAEETALHGDILAALGNPPWATSAAGATPPQALADLLAACELFIGNDSFPMHLATAVGVPAVAIFGPSNAAAWGPYAPDAPQRTAIVRRSDLACSPCFYRGHALGTPQGCPPRPCLTELTPEPVLIAARRLLRRRLAARERGAQDG